MNTPNTPHQATARAVSINAAGATLAGDLSIPTDARGLVVFAHGSGSSRHSPRNRFVADALRAAIGSDGGFAALPCSMSYELRGTRQDDKQP